VSALVRLPTAAVQALLGPEPLFGQGRDADTSAPPDTHVLESVRLRGVPLVFLGLHESAPNDFPPVGGDPAEAARALKGAPYFSVDVSDADEEAMQGLVRAAEEVHAGAKVSFAEARAATRGMSAFDAGVFAEARSMIDWNARNRVRGGCAPAVR
jgi:NAD+ diphosphatase